MQLVAIKTREGLAFQPVSRLEDLQRFMMTEVVANKIIRFREIPHQFPVNKQNEIIDDARLQLEDMVDANHRSNAVGQSLRNGRHPRGMPKKSARYALAMRAKAAQHPNPSPIQTAKARVATRPKKVSRTTHVTFGGVCREHAQAK